MIKYSVKEGEFGSLNFLINLVHQIKYKLKRRRVDKEQ